MIVYGDRSFELSVPQLAREIRKRMSSKAAADLHELRVRSVMCGQLEQAGCDADAQWSAAAEELSELSAQVFVAGMLNAGQTDPDAVRARADCLLAAIADSAAERPSIYRLKVPEGFAWYAVYPDRYVQATLDWLRRAPKSKSVTVVGLRSIGTTLSAVVEATLKARGLAVNRVTVRPEGDPYARRVCLPSDMPRTDAAIVVDEGPGRSGSSMASVAALLSQRGFADRAISLFPAHRNGPGCEGSADVRQWWQRIDIHVAPDDFPPEERKKKRIEMGRGRWVGHAGVAQSELNALAPMLEAPKYLTNNGGDGVLWKFAGFALSPHRFEGSSQTMSQAAWSRLEELANLGLTPAPLQAADGWIGVPWIYGHRLSSDGARNARLPAICRYIGLAARPPGGKSTGAAARQRLCALLIENTEELCGPEQAGLAKQAGDRILCDEQVDDLPYYGDGRLAAHEWVETPGGQLFKLDAAGHDFDHTAVGPQSILWDVAGLIVEWNLPHQLAGDLLQELHLPYNFKRSLACYTAAYAAFRGGVADLCGGDEKHRAKSYYTRHLQMALSAAQVRQ